VSTQQMDACRTNLLNMSRQTDQESVVDAFRNECNEQPQRLTDLFRAYENDPEIRQGIQRLKHRISPQAHVLWLGMGASLCSSLAGALTLWLRGRGSSALEASEWLHFGRGVQVGLAGPIMVTTSGQSAELVELARRNGAGAQILVCNESSSNCWKAAEIRFPILAGNERANATKTYVNSTAACTILASELAEYPWRSDTNKVVDGFSHSLESIFAQRKQLGDFCRHANSIEVVGRGPALPGAMMGALCIREMSKFRAASHSGGGFRHGPLLDVDQTHVAIILAIGRTAELGLRLADDCLARGGRVILVHSQPVDPRSGLLCIQVAEVTEPWESLTSVLPAQALTLALIESHGTRYARLATTTE
jgi:glucosamine--fructose-6-phosphate aminotransferase (isomerizing)